MTPEERVGEIKRLVNQLNDQAGEYAEANPPLPEVSLAPRGDELVANIRQHIDEMRGTVDEYREAAENAAAELYLAEERLAEFEGALTWEDERPIWYEAKGRIMEGQDPKEVLAWVLTWVSGEDILL